MKGSVGMKKQVTFYIDESIAEKAEAIYFALGMDTEMALNVFMRRTVIENRFPIEMGIAASATQIPTADAVTENKISASESTVEQMPSRTNNAITQDMVHALWDAFKERGERGGDLNRISQTIADDTGMSRGSASIYMNILNNLVTGAPNTRNMKMQDLEFYVTKIKEELSAKQYNNALDSLERSLKYWDKRMFGFFANHVRDFLKENGR
jgi:antitoxin component of RelBE/YafQ-DinJ toxin-antitoxin module